MSTRFWYQTEDSAVQLAHHTGTSLGPTSVAEYNWLESRLHSIPLRCFELNVSRRRLDNLQDLLVGLDAYLAALATNGNVQAALGSPIKCGILWGGGFRKCPCRREATRASR